jgi:peptidoglycan DL-endopeptidase RipA
VRRFSAVRAACAVAVGLVVALLPGTSTAGASTAAVSPEQIENAIAYGQAQVGHSLYTGCSAGAYRMGGTPSEEMQFDGRGCGQSYIYILRPGWVGFDCSGLMYMMFQSAGVDFPYTSSAAMAAIPEVSKAEIQRGDLLVNPGHHVAMYLGVADGVPWALESSPKTILEQSGIYRVAEGVQAIDATAYLNSGSYTAHRVG